MEENGAFMFTALCFLWSDIMQKLELFVVTQPFHAGYLTLIWEFIL